MKKRLLTTLAVGISMLSIANMANAVSWSNQTAGTVTVTNIGTLGGSNSNGTGINNAGQVTGYSAGQAFVTTLGGTMKVFGGWSSAGTGINDAGQVTGYSGIYSVNSHAFITKFDGTMMDLGTLGGASSYGWGIT